MRIVGIKHRLRVLLLLAILIILLGNITFSVVSRKLPELPNPEERMKVKKKADLIIRVGNISEDRLEKVEGIEYVEKNGEYVKVVVEDNSQIEKVSYELEGIPEVAYVEENVTYTITATNPNDSYYGSGSSEQWGLFNISAPDAWDSGQGSGSYVIAVLDTGVDWDHEDMIENMWVNTGEVIPMYASSLTDFTTITDTNANGIIDCDDLYDVVNSMVIDSSDDDTNTYTDDFCGWDFVNNDLNPNDDHGHGSHVSGIAGAVTDNSTGVAGTIWDVKIMALKTLNSGGTGGTGDAIDALDYALDNGADIVNMSWRGTSYSQSLQDKLTQLYNGNIVPIAATGNDYSNVNSFYPAAMNNILAVGATNSSDNRVSFSNYGYKVEISAPGVDILSLRAGGTSIGTCSSHLNSNYKYCNGTSMSTPFVSGVAALVWEQNGALNNKQVMHILMENSDAFSPDQYSGRGRLNADDAVDNASITAGVVSQIQSLVEVDEASPTVGDTVNITVTINDGGGDPISSRTIYVQSSRGATDTISDVSPITNGSGIATFTLDSTTSGELYLTAFDDNGTGGDTSDDLVIAFMPTVDYQAGSLDQFGFNTIGEQKTQIGFYITIYAQDQYQNTVTSFSSTVSISDSSGSISPSQSGTFSSGSWIGSVTISSYKAGNIITAQGSGYSGNSNSFNVTHPNAKVVSVSPNYGYNAGSSYIQNVTVTGINFRSNISVRLQKSGQSDITCSNMNVNSTTKLTCRFNTLAKVTKYWNVYVKNYGISTSSNVGSNFFSVFRRSDLNRDWTVDIFDFSQLLGQWGRSGGVISDINGDNTVDLLDFSSMLGQWVSSY
jgi:subtilisin family serine protease